MVGGGAFRNRYCPVPRAENGALFKQYAELAKDKPHVTFVERLLQPGSVGWGRVGGGEKVADDNSR